METSIQNFASHSYAEDLKSLKDTDNWGSLNQKPHMNYKIQSASQEKEIENRNEQFCPLYKARQHRNDYPLSKKMRRGTITISGRKRKEKKIFGHAQNRTRKALMKQTPSKVYIGEI
jgi:hypothetical protein